MTQTTRRSGPLRSQGCWETAPLSPSHLSDRPPSSLAHHANGLRWFVVGPREAGVELFRELEQCGFDCIGRTRTYIGGEDEAGYRHQRFPLSEWFIGQGHPTPPVNPVPKA